MEHAFLLGALENILGKGYKRSRGNYAFKCPVCNHRKPKLEINLHTNEQGENPWECWVCGGSGTRGKTIFSLLKKLHIPSEKAEQILKYVKKGSHKHSSESYANNTFLTLPEEAIQLSTASKTSIIVHTIKNYLHRRGITDNDIIKYDIHYTTSGDYAERIIIPSYSEEGTLDFFIGRTYTNHPRTYNNCDFSKDIIFFENMINWSKPILLCEGVFDAMALRRNAIPMLGKTPSQKLLKKIITSELEDIYIVLDDDAKKEALSLAERLLKLGKRVFLVDQFKGDPSSLGFVKITKVLQEAIELNLRTLTLHKLKMI